MKLDTAAFVVFTVSASTPLVILPSKEDTPTNIVNTIPSIHMTDVFINFDNLSICTLSDIFEIIFNETDINATGINIVFIKLPIKVIINNIIGWSMLADAMFPRSYH